MSNQTKPFEDRSYTIFAVDFDGVLCENDWPRIGRPLENNIKWIRDVRALGNKIILWTNRERLRLDQAVEWCRERGLEFDAVNENLPEVIEYYGSDSRKITADYYIDDKAIVADVYTNRLMKNHPPIFETELPVTQKVVTDAAVKYEVSPKWFPEHFVERGIEDARAINDLFSKTIDERIADGEIDPAYFFEGGQP